MWRTTYFDTLNRLGADHRCDRQTDGQKCDGISVRRANEAKIAVQTY